MADISRVGGYAPSVNMPTANTMNTTNDEARKALTSRIESGIQARNHCGVFNNELEPVFPCSSEAIDHQADAIRAFAREHGWTASITKQCLRVTFRKTRES